jgi:endonuclease-3
MGALSLRERWLRILGILERSVRIREEEFATPRIYRETRDPLKALVATILSQNTSDLNALRAFRSLEERIGVSVEALYDADEKSLEEAIRQGGMYRQRAKKLKALARALKEAGEGHLERLLSLPFEEALKALRALPGVGPKTAEVLLATVRGAPFIPIDTHVRRVSMRLGLHSGGDYARVRAALEAITPPELRHRAHLLLIAFGRSTCRARRPRCYACPVEGLCPYPFKTRLQPREHLGERR